MHITNYEILPQCWQGRGLNVITPLSPHLDLFFGWLLAHCERKQELKNDDNRPMSLYRNAAIESLGTTITRNVQNEE